MSNFGETIFAYAYKGQRDNLRKHLEDKNITTKRDDSGRSLLHWAAAGGHEELVNELISLGLPPDEPDESDMTPLIIAASSNRLQIVHILLAKGAEVNSRNYDGHSALQYACSQGYKQIVELLLKNDADVNIRDKYGATPLHRAASKGHTAIVKLLLNEGNKIDIEAKDSLGNTPLHLACEDGCLQAQMLLTQNGASTTVKNKNGQTPLDLLPPGIRNSSKYIDNDESKGFALFEAILRNICVRNKLNLVCLKCPVSYFKELSDNVKLYDLHSDPRGWKGSNSLKLDDQFSFQNLFSNLVIEESKKEVIMIDSLDKLINWTSFNQIYKELHYLRSNFHSVICFFHGNELEAGYISKLKYFLGCHITILNNIRDTSSKELIKCRAKVNMKKHGGKVLNIIENIQIDVNWDVKSKAEATEEAIMTNSEPEMDSLTTFRLSLDTKEKHARDKLILPYLRKGDEEFSGGKIIYEPDAGDDFDDEDPDDDLDV